jgi:hypothetical protein
MKAARLDSPLVQILLLVLVAVAFSAANWLKMSTLWMDAPRSLFEMYRASMGEFPYRDFTLPYPPLAIAVCGQILRWFGATFTVAQVTVGLLSLACLLAAWLLARKLAPPLPAMISTLALAVTGGTNGGNFALFSLDLYSPSILVGALGLLLASSGLVIAIRERLTSSAVALLIFGGFISCLGKPESAAGLLVGLFCLVLAELHSASKADFSQKLTYSLRVAACSLAPAVLAYAGILVRLGPRPVIEGVTAYGLASIACPWWPTGYGLVGAAAALGAALVGLGVFVLFGIGRPPSSEQNVLILTLPPIGVGAVCWLAYTRLAFTDLVSQQPIRGGPLAIAYYLVSANTFVLPLMWVSALMLILEAISYLRIRTRRNSEDEVCFVILGLIFGVSTRELFNNAISQATQATPLLYAIIFPAFPLIVERALVWWNSLLRFAPSSLLRQRVYVAGNVALCLFGAVRVAGYSVREARKHYLRINTDAGLVRVADDGVSADVYYFLKENTAPEEPIADIAYGGGINFALHRRSPLYTTQFANFRPTLQHRQRDYLQLLAARTRFVINRDPPEFRYGTAMGCAFPGFVWKAVAPASGNDVAFPILQLVREQYRPRKRFGDIVIYERIVRDGSE